MGLDQTGGGLWGVSIGSIEDGFTETGREELAGTGSDAGGLCKKVGGIGGGDNVTFHQEGRGSGVQDVVNSVPIDRFPHTCDHLYIG